MASLRELRLSVLSARLAEVAAGSARVLPLPQADRTASGACETRAKPGWSFPVLRLAIRFCTRYISGWVLLILHATPLDLLRSLRGEDAVSIRLRPLAFARYRAWSAANRTDSASDDLRDESAIPILTVTERGASTLSCAKRRIASALRGRF